MLNIFSSNKDFSFIAIEINEWVALESNKTKEYPYWNIKVYVTTSYDSKDSYGVNSLICGWPPCPMPYYAWVD